MTIDEAIDFAEDINATVTFPSDSKLDEEFFDNIPEWLEELKDYRDKNKMVVKIDVMNIQELKDKIHEAYKKGRADQKEEDNAFFNFEGAWELEKKKVRANAIDEIIKLVDDELTMDIGMDLLVDRDLLCERLEELKEQI